MRDDKFGRFHWKLHGDETLWAFIKGHILGDKVVDERNCKFSLEGK